jgi:hypothetical protein
MLRRAFSGSHSNLIFDIHLNSCGYAIIAEELIDLRCNGSLSSGIRRGIELRLRFWSRL